MPDSPQSERSAESDPSVCSRRRGGQPDTTNRLVRGRYSRHLSPDLTAHANCRRGRDPDLEIAMARVHLVQLIKAQQRAPAERWLCYDRAIVESLGKVISLISAHQRRERSRPNMQQILQAFRQSPPDPPSFDTADSNPI